MGCPTLFFDDTEFEGARINWDENPAIRFQTIGVGFLVGERTTPWHRRSEPAHGGKLWAANRRLWEEKHPHFCPKNTLGINRRSPTTGRTFELEVK